MGNIAIALIYSSVHVADAVQSKRQKQLEQKRVRSLIPRYLARLHDRDCSIATLSLNGLGVDAKILRRLSGPLLSEYTRVRELYLEHNRLGPEEATCIARILSRNTSLEHVSLAHNPGKVGSNVSWDERPFLSPRVPLLSFVFFFPPSFFYKLGVWAR